MRHQALNVDKFFSGPFNGFHLQLPLSLSPFKGQSDPISHRVALVDTFCLLDGSRIGYSHGLSLLSLDQISRHIFMNDAGHQSLVRNALLRCDNLHLIKVL